MPRFAMIHKFTGWEAAFPSGQIEKFGGQEFVALDSLEFTEKERETLKKRRIPVYCPLCEEEVYFKRAFIRQTGEHVNPHWVHKHDRENDCYTSEGVAHAKTKRFLFGKLAEKGYKVREERVHKFGDRYVRADVAVLEEKRDGEVLKLVVEVQASDMRVAEAKKRMAAYYQEGAPVAWVLLLDQFFKRNDGDGPGYAGIHGEVDPKKEYLFGVTGEDKPLFNFLMDAYQYIIGFQQNGRVFLIRRSPYAAARREEALRKKKPWSTANEEFFASLIQDQKIADVLLGTPLIPMEYTPEEKEPAEPKKRFSGKECEGEEQEPKKQVTADIDLEGGRTLGETLDTIALIRETWAAAQRAREKIERQEREEKERRERMEAERRRREAERRRMEEERMRREIERQRIEEEHRRRAEEERRRIEEERRRLEEELRRMEIERINQLREAQEAEEKARQKATWEKALWVEELSDSDQEAIQLRESIWDEYTKIPRDDRLRWERGVFGEANLPIWFFSRKLKLEQREYKLLKKRRRKTAAK